MHGDADAAAMLAHLEELAHRLGITVRYETLVTDETGGSRGGLCQLRGKSLILIDDSLTIGERARVLARSLSRLDLSDVFVVPAVRELLESSARDPR